MKVSELEGAELDYWVAKADGCLERHIKRNSRLGLCWIDGKEYAPSENWNQGGPIIKRETIGITPSNARPNCDIWWSNHPAKGWSIKQSGPTPLIAAMRAYVASKYGDEVND